MSPTSESYLLMMYASRGMTWPVLVYEDKQAFSMLIEDGMVANNTSVYCITEKGIEAAEKIIHPRRKYIVTTHYGTEHVVIADSRNQARYMVAHGKSSYLKMKARLAR